MPAAPEGISKTLIKIDNYLSRAYFHNHHRNPPKDEVKIRAIKYLVNNWDASITIAYQRHNELEGFDALEERDEEEYMFLATVLNRICLLYTSDAADE